MQDRRFRTALAVIVWWRWISAERVGGALCAWPPRFGYDLAEFCGAVGILRRVGYVFCFDQKSECIVLMERDLDWIGCVRLL